jgi:hypothetical protein
MTEHKFKIGQLVHYYPRKIGRASIDLVSGLYQIIKRLPPTDDGECQYEIRSTLERVGEAGLVVAAGHFGEHGEPLGWRRVSVTNIVTPVTGNFFGEAGPDRLTSRVMAHLIVCDRVRREARGHAVEIVHVHSMHEAMDGRRQVQFPFHHAQSRDAIAGEVDVPVQLERLCYPERCVVAIDRDGEDRSGKPRSRWTTSPILPCLSFRQGQLADAVSTIHLLPRSLIGRTQSCHTRSKLAKAADQFFEYRGCHERTGMLNAVTQAANVSA